jgi:glycerophosphoryl diester phosphodiesterase
MTATKEKRFPFAETLSRVKRDFTINLSNLLIFDIFFKVVATVIFGPVSAWIFNRMVKAGGSLVIGNEQILSFILTPIGIVAFIVSGGLTLAIIFTEQAGLILIAARTQTGRTMKFFEVFFTMLKYLRVLIELGIRQVIMGGLYLAPLAAVGGVTFLILGSQHDLNYLLVEKPPVFWIGAAIAAIMAICALLVIGVLYVRWIFSVPLCVLEDKKAGPALRKSRKLVAGNFLRIAVIIFGWSLLMIAVTAITAFLLDVVSESFLKSIGENPALVIAAVVVLLALYAMTAAALAFIAFAVSCLLITRLYYHIRGQKGLPATSQPGDVLAEKFAQPSRRKIVWGVALLALVFTTVSSFFIIEGIDVDRKVAVTAHRGSSKDAPENTLSAVHLAIEDGADFAEIDVQETADGVIVLLHDTDFMRVAGVNKKIWELSYAEIKTLDAGSWFSSEFQHEHVPTLTEILKLARGEIKLNIELKFNGHEKQLVEKVVKIIQDNNFKSQCVISSLNFEGLKKVRALDPELKIGYIIAKAIGNMFRVDTDFLSLNSGMVTADVVAGARKRKIEVHAWTINTADNMSYFINLGVDNIITDYPAKLVSLINERDSLSDIEKLLLVAADMLKR